MSGETGNPQRYRGHQKKKRMEATAFEQLVAEVLDSLPPQFATHLQNVEVIIEPRLTREIRRQYDLKRGEVLYGLYQGVPLTERSVWGLHHLPDTITIFQEPLERDYPDPARLRREVRRTVLHELAHHLGISDDRLEELGAY